jgi:hypothetical protein
MRAASARDARKWIARKHDTMSLRDEFTTAQQIAMEILP